MMRLCIGVVTLPVLLLTFGCKRLQPEQIPLSTFQADTIGEIVYRGYRVGERLDSVVGYKGNSRFFAELYQDGDLMHQVHYDDDQHMTEQSFFFEGILMDDSKEFKASFLRIHYDLNGSVKTIGLQGFYNGTGVPVGTWKEYEEGRLVRSIYYHNDTFGQDYIRFQDYKFSEGKRTLDEFYSNNFILYETDSISLTKDEYEMRRDQ